MCSWLCLPMLLAREIDSETIFPPLPLLILGFENLNVELIITAMLADQHAPKTAFSQCSSGVIDAYCHIPGSAFVM